MTKIDIAVQKFIQTVEDIARETDAAEKIANENYRAAKDSACVKLGTALDAAEKELAEVVLSGGTAEKLQNLQAVVGALGVK